MIVAPKPPLDVHPPIRTEPKTVAGAETTDPRVVAGPGVLALAQMAPGQVTVNVVAEGVSAIIHAPEI